MFWQLVVGLIIAIVSFLLGAFGQRYLQRRGQILLRVDTWNLIFVGNPDSYGQPTETDYQSAFEANGHLAISIWNSKEVKTALHGIKIIFRNGKQEILECELYEGNSVLSQINLPSKEWVSAHLAVFLKQPQLKKVQPCKNAIFAGYTPENKQVSTTIAETLNLANAPAPNERVDKIREIIRDKKLENSPIIPEDIKETLAIIYRDEGFSLAEIQAELGKWQ
jgi:hypothetical protein